MSEQDNVGTPRSEFYVETFSDAISAGIIAAIPVVFYMAYGFELGVIAGFSMLVLAVMALD